MRHALYLLPLSVSVAIAQALESFGLLQVQIKWPNDIYVCGKKIAGILIETRAVKASNNTGRAKKSRQMVVVVGVGLNYDMTALAQSDSQEEINFTDVCEQINIQYIESRPSRAEVAASLLSHVVDVCQKFEQQAESYLAVFRSGYDYCRQKNLEIILDNKEILTGVAQGVTDRAELLVTIEGKEHVFNSADVSVRHGPVEIRAEKKVAAKVDPPIS
jgi:BirA family biotin operon repressor/biotin-[acetyl-CoA-carboxylase] ligase